MQPNHHLKQERTQRGWSQARLAEQLGTDAGNVSRWERGFSVPSPYFRERLCDLFGKSAQELGLLLNGSNRKVEGAASQMDVSSEGWEAGLRAEESGKDEGMVELGGGATEATRSNGEAPSLWSVSLSERPPMTEFPVVEPSAEGLPSRAARVLGGVSYGLGWVTGLIVLLFNRRDRFVLFHSLQAFCFFVPIQLTVVLFGLADAWLERFPALHTLLGMGIALMMLVALVAWPLAIYQAAHGRYYQLPLVGRWCERLAWRLVAREEGRPNVPSAF